MALSLASTRPRQFAATVLLALTVPASAQAMSCVAPPKGWDAMDDLATSKVAFVGTAQPGLSTAQGWLDSPATFTVDAQIGRVALGSTTTVHTGTNVESNGGAAVTPGIPDFKVGEQWLLAGFLTTGKGKGKVSVTDCGGVYRRVRLEKAPVVRVGSKRFTAGFSDIAGKAVLGQTVPDLPYDTTSLKIRGAQAVRFVRGHRIVKPEQIGPHRWSLRKAHTGDTVLWLDRNGLWGVRFPGRIVNEPSPGATS